MQMVIPRAISMRSMLKPSVLPKTQFDPGENEILVEGLDTGLYFSHLTSGDFTVSERFVVIE